MDIYHHGIKDQRWGFRRYQNRDGTLTELGKKRRAKLRAELKVLDGAPENGASAQTKKNKKRDVSEMSDTELKTRVDRLKQEAEYKRLTAKPPSKALKILSSAGSFVVKNYGPKILDAIINSILDDEPGLGEDRQKEKKRQNNEAGQTDQGSRRKQRNEKKRTKRKRQKNGDDGNVLLLGSGQR